MELFVRSEPIYKQTNSRIRNEKWITVTSAKHEENLRASRVPQHDSEKECQLAPIYKKTLKQKQLVRY